jgi:hypothetical protein
MAQEPDAGIDLDMGADASRSVGDLGPNDAADWGTANARDSPLEERRFEPSVPPEAIYTELVFKTLFTRWKRGIPILFAGPRPPWIAAARVVDIRDRPLHRPRV